MTADQLEELMLPPPGWKVDENVLRAHFWLTHAIGDEGLTYPVIIAYPFWPAFFEIVLENGQVKERSMRTYGSSASGLISDALDSKDPVIKTRAALWLRQNYVLYFTGFRLSTIRGQRPYAPWINPENARRLDQMAAAYVAAQKVMRVGKKQSEITALQMTDWITCPRSTALPDIVSYYDMLQASDETMAVDHIYPIRWVWIRQKGNQRMKSRTSINSDLGDLYAGQLLPGTLSEDPADPVSLWLRDVILSYIAGKELLEGKHLRLKDKEDEPLLKEALQQWWAGLEAQAQKSPAAPAGKKD